MEKLELKYEQLHNALSAFEQVVERYQNPTRLLDHLEQEMIRESLIQRFEYSIDLLWKYLKQYLEDKHDIIQSSPRNVIDECFKQKIINKTEGSELRKAIKDRNNTSHIYDEAVAKTISQHALSYFPILLAVYQKTKP